jgi:hypothetical protein
VSAARTADSVLNPKLPSIGPGSVALLAPLTFIDDPEGVEKCQKENPDAFIIHLIIVDPPRCEQSTWLRDDAWKYARPTRSECGLNSSHGAAVSEIKT